MQEDDRMKKLLSFLEFSKLLLLFFLIVLAILTDKAVDLCYYAIDHGYTSSLPWFTTLLTAAWGGFSTALSFYFNKSKTENVAKNTNKEYYP